MNTIIKEELIKLGKGVIVVSGTIIMLVVVSVGVEKFRFVENFGISVWGFVGMLAFLIAWVVVYGRDIKRF